MEGRENAFSLKSSRVSYRPNVGLLQKAYVCWLNANALGNPTPLLSMSNRIYGTLKFEGNKSFVKREKKRGLKFETCQDDPSPMRQTRLSGSHARQIAKLYIYQRTYNQS